MPQIKKITELKPRIREIKTSENNKKEESELVEDIEEAETTEKQEAAREFASASRFKAPSIVLESSTEEAETEPRQTQIQVETEQRREVHERNLTYSPRKESEQRQAYRSTEYNSLALESNQTSARDTQTFRQPLFRRVGGEEIRRDVRDESDAGVLPSERQYKEKRKRE